MDVALIQDTIRSLQEGKGGDSYLLEVGEGGPSLHLRVTFGRENDRRFLASIGEIRGCLQYGLTKMQAFQRVCALALRIIADDDSRSRFLPEYSSLDDLSQISFYPE